MSATPEAVARWAADREAFWSGVARRAAERRAAALPEWRRHDWPVPERAAAPAGAEGVPTVLRVVLSAQGHAQRAGWTVLATYARGTAVTGRAPNYRPGPVVESWALRCRRGGARAVAVWVSGRFDFAMMWGAEIELWFGGLTEWFRMIESAAESDLDGKDTEMPQIASFTGVPRDADKRRAYTKIDWAALADGNTYKLVKGDSASGADFPGTVASVREQATRHAKAKNLKLEYETGDDSLTVRFTPRPAVEAPAA